MARVLYVSKPIAPPWNDSGKNLVKDLAAALVRHAPCVMVRRGEPSWQGGVVRSLAVYPPAAGGFTPALADQARVFGALLRDREHALWHFFFAPNLNSCLAGGFVRRVRGRHSVHTVCSAPRDPRAIVPRLFADVHAVLSRHTERRLREAGLNSDRVQWIPPAIVAPSPPPDRQQVRARFGLPRVDPVVVYPGDLEFGEGGRLCVHALRALARRDVTLVMACRAKTHAARHAETALRAEVQSWGLASQVIWVGETPAIHALLAAADVVALPSRDLYAKMDYPLVLLEAMALERPVIVAEGSPAAELGDSGACVVAAEAAALSAALARLLDDAEAARSLGARGARAVHTTYSPASMARAYESLYDRLL